MSIRFLCELDWRRGPGKSSRATAAPHTCTIRRSHRTTARGLYCNGLTRPIRHTGAIYLPVAPTYPVFEQHLGEGCSTLRPTTPTRVWGVLFCPKCILKQRGNAMSSEGVKFVNFHQPLQSLKHGLIFRVVVGNSYCPRLLGERASGVLEGIAQGFAPQRVEHEIDGSL